MTRFDVAVVGLGAMGSATAATLAARGRRVVGVEQFGPDHALGSSHGAARIFRLAYEQDDYVALAAEALPLWRALEAEAGVAILTQTGAVDYGTRSVLDRIAAAMARSGLSFEWLEPAQACRRWGGIAFDGPVLHSPDGGRTDAGAARAALQDVADRHGADLRYATRVSRVSARPRGVVVETETGDIEADVVVVTVNAWASILLGRDAGLPPLRVTQEQPAFFRPLDAGTSWPSFIEYAGDGTSAADFACYGLASPAEGGVKVGEHGTGTVVDPDGVRPPVDLAGLARLSDYVRTRLPGLDPEPLSAATCLYATTPTEDFVLDRAGSVVVGVGFSGHGFKFTPAIGRVLADLADGVGRPATRFRLRQ